MVNPACEATWSVKRDYVGGLITTESPEGRWAEAVLDPSGRRVTEVRAEGREPVRFEYETVAGPGQGRLTAIEIGTGAGVRRTDFSYKPNASPASSTDGALELTVDPDGGYARVTYDDSERLETVWRPDEQWDGVGWTAAEGGVGLGYDASGNLVSLWPPEADLLVPPAEPRAPHEFEYTPAGDRSRYSPPEAVAGGARDPVDYRHDADGRPLLVRYADGESVRWSSSG